jgi:ANTAR domain-containing protein
MDGTSLRIASASRAQAESLHRVLGSYRSELVERDDAWHVEVQLGELAALLVSLFETLGSWLDSEEVDSLLLHFDEREFTLLRPSKAGRQDSSGFLLERVAQLETALESRIVIEQAKGILAHARRLSTDEAFEVLRKAVRDRGAKLRDLAERITASPEQVETILAEMAASVPNF